MSEPHAELIDGVRCYAPELARSRNDYPPEGFARLFAAEAGNFWFRARNRILLGLFRKFVRTERAQVLEIGCGTGFVLHGLSQAFPQWTLTGAEGSLEGLRFARQRLAGLEFIQLDARALPFESAFDAIGAFDVIEHITEDEQVLASAFRALRPGGHLFVSVPQHPSLWSANDDHAHHKRRYRRHELDDKVTAAGFRVVRSTSFVTTLFPAMALSRRRQRHDLKALTQDEALELSTRELTLPKPLDLAFDLAMRLDGALIAAGLSLPFGGSRVVVAQKPAL